MKKKELQQKLVEDGIRPRDYAFDDYRIPDILCLDHNYFFWEYYYRDDHGKPTNIRRFWSEDEACEWFYEKVSRSDSQNKKGLAQQGERQPEMGETGKKAGSRGPTLNITSQEMLLNHQYLPLTSILGWVKMDCSTLVERFLEGPRAKVSSSPLIQRPFMRVRQQKINGNLETCLRSLLPFVLPSPDRYLFVPAQNGWTAFWCNRYCGSDPTMITPALRSSQTRSVWLVVTPDTQVQNGVSVPVADSSALIWQVHDHEGEQPNRVRCVHLTKDYGKIRFEQEGEPLPFEDTASYSAENLEERITLKQLKKYLLDMGIRPFDTDFYQEMGATLLTVRTDSSDYYKISMEQAIDYFLPGRDLS